MKIEKVNDHQIRCTLTREDLASRRLKMSELAYGSEKAKDLFRDMMEMANDEYGFEADNIPLMIEAIPVSGECIVLVITKVEDPEELDTRFSKFAPSISDDSDEDASDESDFSTDALNISDLFKRFKEAGAPSKEQVKTEAAKKDLPFSKMSFSFESMEALINASSRITKVFAGSSSLYRNTSTGMYLLIIKKEKMDTADFIPVCNMLGEFGTIIRCHSISEGYLNEHYEVIIPHDAIEMLAELK